MDLGNIVLVLLFVLFVPAFQNPKPHFEQENWKIFFAIYGFVAFAFIVLAGQHLRKLVGRKEDYYEERE